MNPQEKAEELFVRFNKDGLHQISPIINRIVRKQMIKQCAVIAVDEIIKTVNMCIPYHNEETNVDFWSEVKQEIEKL